MASTDAAAVTCISVPGMLLSPDEALIWTLKVHEISNPLYLYICRKQVSMRSKIKHCLLTLHVVLEIL